jgi:hypothetical protein
MPYEYAEYLPVGDLDIGDSINLLATSSFEKAVACMRDKHADIVFVRNADTIALSQELSVLRKAMSQSNLPSLEKERLRGMAPRQIAQWLEEAGAAEVKQGKAVFGQTPHFQPHLDGMPKPFDAHAVIGDEALTVIFTRKADLGIGNKAAYAGAPYPIPVKSILPTSCEHSPSLSPMPGTLTIMGDVVHSSPDFPTRTRSFASAWVRF